MANKKQRTKYYQVEFSTDSAQTISSACILLAYLYVGKIDVLETIIINAYRQRTGTDPTPQALSVIRDALKTIQFVAWDSTYGSDIDIHGKSKFADSLIDIVDVINYQMKLDEIEPYKDDNNIKYPVHWSDDVPLPRIIKTYDSVYNRNKQLTVFPSDK